MSAFDEVLAEVWKSNPVDRLRTILRNAGVEA